VLAQGGVVRDGGAVAIAKGRIQAVGSDAEIVPLWGTRARLIDLGRRVVLPGFIDSHTHLELTCVAFEHAVDCRTPPHERIDDIVQTLRQAAGRTPRGAWIVGQGNLLQEMKLRDKRYPTAAALDRASAEHPVVLRCSVHAVVLNT